MRVFVTGASGWIGSAVVPELLGARPQRRSGSPAPTPRPPPSTPPARRSHRGALDDLDSLRGARRPRTA